MAAFTGLSAALLLGLNALVLLHDRRAMAEAALTFGVLLALWSFLTGKRHPWLIGLGLALAFNAKQTGLVLLPVGLLAVALPGRIAHRPKRPPGWDWLPPGSKSWSFSGCLPGCSTHSCGANRSRLSRLPSPKGRICKKTDRRFQTAPAGGRPG